MMARGGGNSQAGHGPIRAVAPHIKIHELKKTKVNRDRHILWPSNIALFLNHIMKNATIEDRYRLIDVDNDHKNKMHHFKVN